MKITFDEGELSEIEQMADMKDIDVGELKLRYVDIVEQNFWQDMSDALNTVRETEY